MHTLCVVIQHVHLSVSVKAGLTLSGDRGPVPGKLAVAMARGFMQPFFIDSRSYVIVYPDQ